MEDLEFSVRSTDGAFLELVRSYLEPFRVDHGPDDVNFQADCGLSRVLPGGKVLRPKASLYLGRVRIYCGPRWEEMAGRLISGVRDMVTGKANEFFRLRAAAGVVDGGAVILPSPPNPHLPALAALLARSGAGYLGDEVVYLDPILRRIHGLPLPMLIAAEDLAYFPEVAGVRASRRRETRGRPDGPDARVPRRPVTVRDLGGHMGTPAALKWIVFPSITPGETTRLESVDASEALFGLMGAMLNAHVWADRALILLREVVDTLPVARLVSGSLPEAAAALMDLPAQVVPSG